MRVADWMTTQVHTCHPTDSLADVARTLREMDCGCLPVVDRERRVLGILTDRDICMIAGDTEIPLEEITVASLEQRTITTCSPTDDPARVLELILASSVRRLPVVNAEGGLVGIVSLGDLAGLVTGGATSETHEIGATQVAAALARLSKARYRTRYSDSKERGDDRRTPGHDRPPLG